MCCAFDTLNVLMTRRLLKPFGVFGGRESPATAQHFDSGNEMLLCRDSTLSLLATYSVYGSILKN